MIPSFKSVTSCWPTNEIQVSEERGEWAYEPSANFYELDMTQWRLVVEEVTPGHWCAKVVLGVDSDSASPVRMSGSLPTLARAKRWAVLALHEVARSMLDVKVPNMYEVTATDEVHTLGAPFDEYIR